MAKDTQSVSNGGDVSPPPQLVLARPISPPLSSLTVEVGSLNTKTSPSSQFSPPPSLKTHDDTSTTQHYDVPNLEDLETRAEGCSANPVLIPQDVKNPTINNEHDGNTNPQDQKQELDLTNRRRGIAGIEHVWSNVDNDNDNNDVNYYKQDIHELDEKEISKLMFDANHTSHADPHAQTYNHTRAFAEEEIDTEGTPAHNKDRTTSTSEDTHHWLTRSHTLELQLHILTQTHAEALDRIERLEAQNLGLSVQVAELLDDVDDAREREMRGVKEVQDALGECAALGDSIAEMGARIGVLCGVGGGIPHLSSTPVEGGDGERVDGVEMRGGGSGSNTEDVEKGKEKKKNGEERDGDNTSAYAVLHISPHMYDPSATSFYFFPTVSTTVLLGKKREYFTWPRGSTLTSIRSILRDRDWESDEEHEGDVGRGLLRIKEILDIRDERGLVDPESAADEGRKMVYVSLPEHRDLVYEPAVEREAWEPRTPIESVSERLWGFLGTESGSEVGGEGRERGRHLGGFINAFDGVDGRCDFCSDSEEVASAVSRDTVGEEEEVPLFGYERGDGAVCGRGGGLRPRRSSLLAQPSEAQAGEASRKSTPPPTELPTTSRPLTPASRARTPRRQARTSDDEQHFVHPRDRGCESWIGSFDPNRSSCTFCHCLFEDIGDILPSASLNAGFDLPAVDAHGPRVAFNSPRNSEDDE